MRTILLYSILLTGCTFNFQIDTDYASQAGGAGTIQEEVKTEAVTTPTVDVEAEATGL
ncbi:hypothetical protein VPHK436_0058 [Vibrio phage K436]